MAAQYSNTDLKNGIVFRDGDNVFIVLKYEHSFRGRGSGIVKVKVRDINSGVIVEKSYRAGDRLEAADTRKMTIQFLYSDGSNAVFMSTEDYSQFEIPVDSISDSLPYLKEGEKVVALYLDDNPISIEIPKAVDLAIEYTEPAVKGNTSNNAMKNAVLENKLEVGVPLFCKVGDIVKINTDTGSYVSRVQN